MHLGGLRPGRAIEMLPDWFHETPAFVGVLACFSYKVRRASLMASSLSFRVIERSIERIQQYLSLAGAQQTFGAGCFHMEAVYSFCFCRR